MAHLSAIRRTATSCVSPVSRRERGCLWCIASARYGAWSRELIAVAQFIQELDIEGDVPEKLRELAAKLSRWVIVQ
jgi:hypothetical protein